MEVDWEEKTLLEICLKQINYQCCVTVLLNYHELSIQKNCGHVSFSCVLALLVCSFSFKKMQSTELGRQSGTTRLLTLEVQLVRLLCKHSDNGCGARPPKTGGRLPAL